jgi:hypothetical protein
MLQDDALAATTKTTASTHLALAAAQAQLALLNEQTLNALDPNAMQEEHSSTATDKTTASARQGLLEAQTQLANEISTIISPDKAPDNARPTNTENGSVGGEI